jgi:hypothetical protein
MAYKPSYNRPEKVKGVDIEDGAITSEKISDQGVARRDIANESVTSEKIKPGAVHARHLDEDVYDALGLQSVPDNSIGTEKIQAKAVTASKLADGSVTRDKIATSAVTNPKIKDGAVTPEKLSFTPATRPLTPPVATDELADTSVTPVKLDAIDTPLNGEVPTYNQAQAKFEWKPGAGGIQMKTGTYVGDGNASQSITGVGFQPKVLIVFSQAPGSTPDGFLTTDQDAGWTRLFRASATNYNQTVITSLDPDGFTVDLTITPESPNESGVTYTYIALG